MCDVHVAFTNLSEIVLMLFQGQADAEFSVYFSSSGNFKRSIHYIEKVASAAHWKLTKIGVFENIYNSFQSTARCFWKPENAENCHKPEKGHEPQIRTNTRTHTKTHTQTQTHTHTHTPYVYMCLCIYMYLCVYICIQWHIYIYDYICIHIYIYIHIYIHILIYICRYLYTSICVFMYKYLSICIHTQI